MCRTSGDCKIAIEAYDNCETEDNVIDWEINSKHLGIIADIINSKECSNVSFLYFSSVPLHQEYEVYNIDTSTFDKINNDIHELIADLEGDKCDIGEIIDIYKGEYYKIKVIYPPPSHFI